MGARGPKPTPTATLKLRGSWLAKKREREGEPLPAPGKPNCPRELKSKPARALFKRVVNRLATVDGLLSQLDDQELARYCTLLESYWECRDKIDQHGLMMPVKDRVTIRDGDGKITGTEDRVVGLEVSPYMTLSLRLSEKLCRMEADFGFNPSARSRLRLGDALAGAASRTVAAEPGMTSIVRRKVDFIA